MIKYFDGDVRRINHALKVAAFAELIADGEALAEPQRRVLEAVAPLHDIGIHEAERKHGSTAGRWQEEEGPPIARAILEKLGADAALIDRVCFITGHHHQYDAVDAVDFRVLVEADALVNIFEDELAPKAVSALKDIAFRTPSGLELLERLYSRKLGHA